MTRLILPTLIVVLSVGIGLLGSYPHYLLAVVGIAAIAAVGFLGEGVFLGIVVISSGLSLAFLTGGQRTLFSTLGGANIDGLRLALVIGGFVSLASRRPSILAPIRQVGIYAVFLLYAAATMLWSPNHFDGFRMFCKLFYPVIVFLLAVAVSNRYATHTFARVAVATILAATLLNVTVAAFGASLFSEGFTTRFHGASHPNSIGLFSVFAGLVVYAWWRREGGKGYIVLLLILLVELIATGSRTALVAGGVGLLIFEWFSRRRGRAVSIAALCIATWLVVPTFGERTLQSGADAGFAPTGLGSSVNVSGRMLLWTDAWSALMGDHQLFGRGIGATDHFFTSRYSDIASIHNGYLLLMIDSGLVGLVLVLGFFAVAVMKLTRRKSMLRAADQGVGVLALALTVMYLLATMTESTFGGFDFPTVITWAVYGLVWRQGSGRGDHSLDPPPRRIKTWSFGTS